MRDKENIEHLVMGSFGRLTITETWTRGKGKRYVLCRHVTLNGKTQTLTQWARGLGIKSGTIRDRLARGWSVEEAYTTKVI